MLPVLAFASGFVSLVYEILWMRHLRVLFGSGTLASAAVLSVFFAGLAVGSALFGRRATCARSPLKLYAFLEAAAAASALLAFAVPSVADVLHEWDGGSSAVALQATRIGAAFALLLPASVFLGGTLPVLGEVFAEARPRLVRAGGAVYGWHTVGAAGGALLAGFVLPGWLGFRISYAAAMTVSGLLAGIAFALGGTRFPSRPLSSRSEAPTPTGEEHDATVPFWALTFAAASGAAALALEVLCTRMFALVLYSSVYAFTAILVAFLAAVALGAVLAIRLADRLPRDLQLFALLLGAGLAAGLCPFALHWATGQLGSIPLDWGFAPHTALLFGTLAVVVVPPATLGGAILPSLLRYAQGHAGPALGLLLAANTAGGVVGSLVGGFLLLPALGLWRSVTFVALVYLGLAVFAVSRDKPAARHLRPAALVAAVLLGTFLDPSRLTLVRVEPGEVVDTVWETPRGILAVTHDAAGRRLRLNNTYILGGEEGRDEETFQATLPLALHPSARRVFVLGLGSGLTAAAALSEPVEHLTVVELLPEVIEASRVAFEADTKALFTDRRATVVAGDGRALLATTNERWDLILGDLFLPWLDGAGRLYSREHFSVIRDRLASGGRFAQWLPLFQLTRGDFDTIAATMLAVFGEVELWQADFRDGAPIALLITGRGPDTSPLPHGTLIARLENHREVFASAPLETDDHPVLEYQAPLSQAAVRSGRTQWLVGRSWDALVRDLNH